MLKRTLLCPHFAKALDANNSFSLANKHYLKAADLAALEGDYYKAIEHYEKIGRSSISNNLMKWSVKDYFLKAGICHLATNVCVRRDNRKLAITN
jgi:alpha-soluble NSF attachment protein